MVQAGEGSEPERLLGEVYVTTRLSYGYERLRIVFTSRRVVIAHLGKRGVGAAASVFLLGGAGTGVEDIVLSGKERGKKKQKSPQEILEMDKENFDISYEEIVGFDCHEGNRVLLVTGGDKYDFHSSVPIRSDLLKELQGILGPKMRIY